MGFDVQLSSGSVIVNLTGWDRVANLRRRIEVDLTEVRQVEIESRSDLERLVDHRILGFGTHNGEQHPNRRRVGTMLGRSVSGKQFWAVPASDPSCCLLVLNLSAAADFERLVLAVDDPHAFADELERSRHR